MFNDITPPLKEVTLSSGTIFDALPSKKYIFACINKETNDILLCNRINNWKFLTSEYIIGTDVTILALEGNNIFLNYYFVEHYDVHIYKVKNNEIYDENIASTELSNIIKTIGNPYNNILYTFNADNIFSYIICTDLCDKKHFINDFKEMLIRNYNYFGCVLNEKDIVYEYNVLKTKNFLFKVKVKGFGIASETMPLMYWYKKESFKVSQIYPFNRIYINV